MGSTTSALETNPAIITVSARAKLNLTLDVLGRRPDGYHDLRSLVIGVDLADTVRVQKTDVPGVQLDCSDPLLAGDDNLACRAAALFAAACGRQPTLKIELSKRIPVGAGLGGGSSDAAAILQICNELCDAGRDRAALAALGARLGSDVPVFFHLPAARMTGRGECVEPVELAWSGWALLAMTGEQVSTAAVYRAWRCSDAEGTQRDMDEVVCHATSAAEIMDLLSNDLEPAVFRVSPAVARFHKMVNHAGIGPMRVSGAGSVFFRLFDNRAEAQQAADELSNRVAGLHTLVVAAPCSGSRRREA